MVSAFQPTIAGVIWQQRSWRRAVARWMLSANWAISTLIMTDHYASLSVEQLKRSHEKYSPLRAEGNNRGEGYGSGYWNG